MRRPATATLATAALVAAGCGGAQVVREAGEGAARSGGRGIEEGGSRLHPGPIHPNGPIRPSRRLPGDPPAISDSATRERKQLRRIRARLKALRLRVGANKDFSCTVATYMAQAGGPPRTAKGLGRYLHSRLRSQFTAGFVEETYDTAKRLGDMDWLAVDDALCTSRPRYGGPPPKLRTTPQFRPPPRLPPPPRPRITPYGS